MNRDSKFRQFVTKMYYEAMKERFLWRQAECPACVWFQQNKYYLKKRFKDAVALD